MLAITGRKVSSSAHTADLSQRAYFKGAESISLPWYEVKAVKNEIEEDVFKMVLHRSFEEKGEERHSNACLMFCDYLKTKPKTNKQTNTLCQKPPLLARLNSVSIVAAQL